MYIGEHGETLKRFPHPRRPRPEAAAARRHHAGGHHRARLAAAARGALPTLGVAHARLRHRRQARRGRRRLLTALGLDWAQAAAIGDDWPDLPVLRRAALRLRAAPTRMPRCVRRAAPRHHGRGRPRRGARVLRPAAGGQRPLRRAAARGTLTPLTMRSSCTADRDADSPWARARCASLDRAARVAVHLPADAADGLLALGTYWLVRNTPGPAGAACRARRRARARLLHARLRRSKTFDAAGRLKSEVHGDEARHYPDTDTLEIDEPRIRSVADGRAC